MRERNCRRCKMDLDSAWDSRYLDELQQNTKNRRTIVVRAGTQLTAENAFAN